MTYPEPLGPPRPVAGDLYLYIFYIPINLNLNFHYILYVIICYNIAYEHSRCEKKIEVSVLNNITYITYTLVLYVSLFVYVVMDKLRIA